MRRSLRNSAALLILALVCPGCDIQFQDCNGDGFVTWDEIESTLMGGACSGSDQPADSQPPDNSSSGAPSPDQPAPNPPDATSGA